jgi:IS5 family transposase
MRKKNRKQMTLMSASIEHPHAIELETFSQILDDNSNIYDMVLQDLTRGVQNRNTGAEGMTAEQVVRVAILKQMEGFSYEDLAFHIVDSRCYRRFCRIGITDKGFQKSALNSNVKAISPETWEAMNRILVHFAKDKKIEKGRESRMDCTVVSSNIHDPTDSSLLFDSVRVLSRMLGQINERFKDINIPFTNHKRRAKKRMIGIMNTNSNKVRKNRYEDLLKVTHKTVNYAEQAVIMLQQYPFQNSALLDTALKIAEDLKQVIALTHRVIDQTTRRVIHGEKVHASEKIVSIFEPHTDIIKKDKRETFYGHKVCLSGGASNLITDCLILDGNPADTALPDMMLDRQKEIYDRYPLKVAFDGGFASMDNLESAKGKGIKDVCFAKKRGIEVEDMCRSDYVFKRLRRFRAGVESGISWLKRCFGFAVVTWKTLRSFKSYVWASIVSANLLTLARGLNSTT